MEFGRAYLDRSGNVNYYDSHKFLLELAQYLDDKDMVITGFLDQQHFLNEYYYREVLGLTPVDPSDIYGFNNVENLETTSIEYEYMTLWVIYEVGKVWEMNFTEWWRQPWKRIEYQLAHCRKVAEQTQRDAENAKKEAENKSVVMDQTGTTASYDGKDFQWNKPK